MMMPAGAINGGAPPVEEVDDQKSEPDQDGKSEKEHTKVASFGHGKIVHPTFLRIKTDGKITELHGARSATGFTVTVPGRRAESTAGLASRDSRIASVKVSHGIQGKRCDVPVQGRHPRLHRSRQGTRLADSAQPPSGLGRCQG